MKNTKNELIYLDKKLNIIRHGLLLNMPKIYDGGQKDPSVAYNPITETWHLYFTDTKNDNLGIGHLTSKNIEGLWKEAPPIDRGEYTKRGVVAPGVFFIDNKMYMYIQETWHQPDGNIIWGYSEDCQNFTFIGPALKSVTDSNEAGIYDAAIKVINGTGYLLYAAFPYPYRDENGIEYQGIHGDVALAKCSEPGVLGSNWDRIGPILKHEDVPFHNSHTDPNREWGLEGGDLIQLKDGSVLMIGVCFLAQGNPCHRQRIFVAHARIPEGPYRTLGVLSEPCNDWGATENGHPCVVRENGRIYVFAQVYTNDWQIGLMSVDEDELISYLNN